ncbi:uncharacterized protein LOC123309947 [Coccinella septempunctata]|uniref:uncharacterized protein LOC123309947 n=1 Tax=Coccinella septempunctata TaxID=41139 RepID=UPI001D068267|nr:uncharacterized protein LOC123309947 [Coccinella septempunctata]
MAKRILLLCFFYLLAQCSSALPQSKSSTEEPINAPLSDLEASFGGSTTTSTSAPETTTPNRRTGFYYLFDWNTFLDVDDVKGTRVNLRFQPKIGDPKRFYNIRTP